jgi:hypothetical protein
VPSSEKLFIGENLNSHIGTSKRGFERVHENDIYKMTKFRKRKMKDFNKVKCIKDEADRLSVKYDEIKNR